MSNKTAFDIAKSVYLRVYTVVNEAKWPEVSAHWIHSTGGSVEKGPGRGDTYFETESRDNGPNIEVRLTSNGDLVVTCGFVSTTTEVVLPPLDEQDYEDRIFLHIRNTIVNATNAALLTRN